MTIDHHHDIDPWHPPTTGRPLRVTVTIDLHAGPPPETVADVILHTITAELRHSVEALVTGVHVELHGPLTNW
ncbi:MAG: hypothetical protein ACRD0C_16220 [Acidimicrobiia bacterium]